MRYILFFLLWSSINVSAQKAFKNDEHFEKYLQKHLQKAQQKKLQSYDAPLSAKTIKTELRILKHTLKEGQPQLFLYTSEAKFDSVFSSAFHACKQGLTYKTYLKEIAKIQHAIGAGHSNWAHAPDYQSYAYNNETYFPFDIRFEGSTCRIYHDCSNATKRIPNGSILIAINDRPISEVLNELKSCHDKDGLSNDLSFHSITESFPLLYNTFIAAPESFKVRFVSPNAQQEEEITTKALLQTQINTHRTKRYFTGKQDVLRRKAQDSAAYYGISSFEKSKLQQSGLNFEQFTHYFFRDLATNETSQLYIDLRGNRGGSLKSAAHLLSYLIQDSVAYVSTEVTKLNNYTYDPIRIQYSIRYGTDTSIDTINSRYYISKETQLAPAPQYNFSGQIIVMTDNLTQSSAASICAILNEHTDAIFIGEETGSPTVGNGGNPVTIALPYTQIRYVFPQGYHKNIGVTKTASAHGVLPDIPILNKPMEFYDWSYYIDQVQDYLKTP